MPLNVAMQQPDIQALEGHPQVSSPKECHTHSNGMDSPAQTRPCRRNPEVEGPFVHQQPSSSVRQYLLDHVCPCGIMDNSQVHFHHGPVTEF